MVYKPESEDKYYKVLPRLLKGESLKKATRAEHTTAKTFKKVNTDLKHATIKPHIPGKRLSINVEYGRTVVIITENGDIESVELDKQTFYRYVFFVDDIQNNKKYKRFTIYDLNGVKYKLSVNFDAYAETLGNAEDWSDLFYPERWNF